MSSGRHQVTIVGGGFGGVAVAKALRKAPVDVTLLDRTNHHLFQPLLYQVATGILSEGEVAPALRSMFRREENVRVLLAEVTDLDLGLRTVQANVPDGDRLTLRYDTLVVAAGATHAYFGHDEWADAAPGMKTIEDARRLRNDVLGAFEMAEASADPAQRDEWLTFVIVGAGPTGVELTGQVAALAGRTLRGEYRNVEPASAKIILLDAGPNVLPPFPEKLRRRAERDLRAMGVDIRLHTAATAIDERGIEVNGPQGEARIPSRTVIWAAGVQASPLAKVLGEASGAEVDRAGRVSVEPDCTCPTTHGSLVFAAPRGLRDRGHGLAQRAAGRRAAGPAGGEVRRQGDRVAPRGPQLAGPVQVLRQGHDGDDRPEAGSCERVRTRALWSPGDADVGVHPRRLPRRLGQPLRHDASLDVDAGSAQPP